MRRSWAVVGVAAIVGGFLAAVVDPGPLPMVAGPTVVRVAATVGLFLGFAALFVVLLRFPYVVSFRPSHASLPDVEEGVRVRTPGDGFDEMLSRPANSDYYGSARETNRDHVRSELRAVVVNSLVVDAGHGRAEAERMVRRGTWTDDRIVAEFLREGSADRSIRERVRRFVDGSSGTHGAVRRTIVELERVRGDRRE